MTAIRFPPKLMQILDENKYPEIISWLPNGRGFLISDKDKLTKYVLPKYFGNSSKFNSFHRKLLRWSFIVQKQDRNKVSYVHPKFVRGETNRCQEIVPGRKLSLAHRTQGSNREIQTQRTSPTTIIQNQTQGRTRTEPRTLSLDQNNFTQRDSNRIVESGSTHQNVMISNHESQNRVEIFTSTINSNVAFPTDSNNGVHRHFTQPNAETNYSSIVNMSLPEITFMQESLQRELNASRRALEELASGNFSQDLSRMFNRGGRQLVTPPPELKHGRRPSLGARAA